MSENRRASTDNPIIPINQLSEAQVLNDSDAVLVVQDNSVTKQAVLSNIGNHIITGQTFDDLQTQNKKIVDAINEVKGIELIGTIPAYGSQIVFNNAYITSNSKIRVFFETFGMFAKDVRSIPGQVVVTINPQAEDTRILVQVT